ncbi:probable D-lactate dehydrogenase, mitochondrial precursor [Phialocephala subalpina]|uniref:D-lactate dehydrogenase (cytochrome) n=1 Tax=Phialocephala subalpina TaxID=576137 RepID=A0A1L7WL83_9HELO|nr:probable D-lactate dehydrogenase, mitochondrial precursor [Phialocephala subalpina]
MSSRHVTRSTGLLRQTSFRSRTLFFWQRSPNSRNSASIHSSARPSQERLNSPRPGSSTQNPPKENRRYEIARLLSLSSLVSILTYYLTTEPTRKQLSKSTTPLSAASKPRHNTTPTNLQAAYTEFCNIVGPGNVSTQDADLDGHAGSDWSSYATKAKEKPSLIVYPASTKEVSEVMKVCHRRTIPVTAYSGGTSLEGHFASTRGGLCIDFARMDYIIALHPRDLDVVVQPAVRWEDLNEQLAEKGLFFPPDPGPGAKIGGMVGTGCSGTNSYRYGTMREWVISLTVVLADGTIIKTRQRPRKSSAGYDLTKMFIGSEGTLGLVTEATLKITVLPKNQRVAIATFPSIHNAAECVGLVVSEGVPISGIEILDNVQMWCINESKSTRRTWKEAPTLFFKFAGTSISVQEQISIVQKAAEKTGSQSFEFASNDEEAQELWSARKEALWSVISMKRKPDDQVWTTDIAVPISKLPDIIEQTKEDIRKSGLLGTIVGHVGDGNFHAFLLFNKSEYKIAEDLVHRMVKRAVDMEGTVTGEHGVGLVKRDYLARELGQETVDAMRKLKQAFDPLCLLNCDKVIRMENVAGDEVSPR